MSNNSPDIILLLSLSAIEKIVCLTTSFKVYCETTIESIFSMEGR